MAADADREGAPVSLPKPSPILLAHIELGGPEVRWHNIARGLTLYDWGAVVPIPPMVRSVMPIQRLLNI